MRTGNGRTSIEPSSGGRSPGRGLDRVAETLVLAPGSCPPWFRRGRGAPAGSGWRLAAALPAERGSVSHDPPPLRARNALTGPAPAFATGRVPRPSPVSALLSAASANAGGVAAPNNVAVTAEAPYPRKARQVTSRTGDPSKRGSRTRCGRSRSWRRDRPVSRLPAPGPSQQAAFSGAISGFSVTLSLPGARVGNQPDWHAQRLRPVTSPIPGRAGT
jgi:hypothetical protein